LDTLVASAIVSMSRVTPNRSWNSRQIFNCARESHSGKVSIDEPEPTELTGRFKTEAIKATTSDTFSVVI
jgi:hypothetical protein